MEAHLPVTRKQLSSMQRARYLEHALELQSVGIDCDIPDEWLEHSRSLEISVAPPSENILRQLPSGPTACAIQVYLVCLVGNLVLKDFAIASEWDSDLIALTANGRGLYSVGPALEFTEREVLNHRFERGLHFRRCGDIAEGWLVACGVKPIPDKYPNRMRTELTLTFTDQFDQPHAAHAQVVLERSTRQQKRYEVVRLSKTDGFYEGREKSCDQARVLPEGDSKLLKLSFER
jgi:hypothetical protein